MNNILIIDDELDMAEAMASLLESEGYVVRAVSGGKEGLEIMRNDSPNLLILDVMMPNMKGLEVIRHMKEDAHMSTIPILLVSASKEPEKVGIVNWDHFLRKPFDIDELLEDVAKLIPGL